MGKVLLERLSCLPLQELHDTLASESSDPESYNQISTLVDIAMEFIAPNMELRQGNLMEISVQVNSVNSISILSSTVGTICCYTINLLPHTCTLVYLHLPVLLN